jgi:hypothetical protein
MTEEEILTKLEEHSEVLEEIQKDIKGIKRFALVRLVVIILVVILPFIGLFIVLPEFLNNLDAQIRSLSPINQSEVQRPQDNVSP